METTRLSTKGQVILPKRVRDSRGWTAGTEFVVEETGEGILLRPARRFQRTELRDVVGCLQYRGKAKTIPEMNSAVDAEVRRRRGRGRY